jgi:hypothetical protein
MLLARQRPLAGRFVKSVPRDATGGPKARGFGARQKLVAQPRQPLRIAAAAPGEAVFAPSAEESAPAAWAGAVDWVGASAESVAPRVNGHAPDDLAMDLPPSAAFPSPAPELRALN